MISASLPSCADLGAALAGAYTKSWEAVEGADGILVPGGFGDRGVEGKVLAVKYAREKRRPFLGVCLGMQCAVIEHARNVVGLKGANSTEFNSKTEHPVVVFMPEINPSQFGGTMRLGVRRTLLRGRPDGKPCLAEQVYGVGTRSCVCCAVLVPVVGVWS